LDEVRLNAIADRLEYLDTTCVIPTMPLNVNISGRIRTLAECCRIFVSIKLGNFTCRFQFRSGALVVEEYRSPASGNDECVVNQTQFPRTNKVVAPGHAIWPLL
jgi:hypothetical protein